MAFCCAARKTTELKRLVRVKGTLTKKKKTIFSPNTVCHYIIGRTFGDSHRNKS